MDYSELPLINSTDPETPSLLKCPDCDHSFMKRSKLNRHIAETHQNIRSYICEECKKEFKRSQHLKRHLLTHNGVRPYSCTYENCPQAFTCKHHLVRHIQLIHEEKLLYQCSKCPFSTKKKRQLNNHKATHITADPTLYLCPVPDCQRTFTRLRAMKKHSGIKHSGELRFECPQCELFEQTYKKTTFESMRKSRAQSQNSKLDKSSSFNRSRFMDFDPILHSAPFLPFQTSQAMKFVYSDAGLSEVRPKSQKLPKYREPSEVKDLLVQDPWRNFPEFDNPGIIITIEYCTNCKQHQNSTRHSESQYFETANLLKQRILSNYDVKVYLKPLIWENDGSLESMRLQRRIGAFEVQMKSNGQQILHSKLQSKRWPDIEAIISAIPLHFKKINFLVQIKFEDGDQRVKDVNIQLRQLISSQRCLSSHSEQRPLSSSFTTNKVINRVKRISSATEAPQQHQRRYQQTTDNMGRALFLGVPLERYTLQISESYNNQALLRTVNLSDHLNGDGGYLEVELLKPDAAKVICEILYQDESRMTPCSDVSVSLNTIQAKEVNGKSGIYEAISEPGCHEIHLIKYGYEALSQNITIVRGINNFRFVMSATHYASQQRTKTQEILNKKYKKFKAPSANNIRMLVMAYVAQITVKDLLTGECIPQVQVKIIDHPSNKIFTTVTNDMGVCKVLQSNLTEGQIQLTNKMYYNKTISYGQDISRNQSISMITRQNQLSILIYQNAEIYQKRAQQISQLQVKAFQDKLELTQNFGDDLSTIFIKLQPGQMINISILIRTNKIIDLSKENKEQYIQYWVVGHIIGGELEEVNELIHSIWNYPNYQIFHEKQANKIFQGQLELSPELSVQEAFYQTKQKCAFVGQNIQYCDQSVSLSDRELVQVLIDDTLVVFFDNLIYLNGTTFSAIFQTEYTRIHQIEERETGQSYNFKQEPLFQVSRTDSLIYFVFKNQSYLAIAKYPSFKPLGCAELNCYHILMITDDRILCVGDYLQIVQFNMLPSRITFKIVKRVKSRCQVALSAKMGDHLLLARSDGVLSVYDQDLQLVHSLKLFNSEFSIYVSNYLVAAQEDILILVDYKIINRIPIRQQVLCVFTWEADLIVYTKDRTMLHKNVMAESKKPADIIEFRCSNHVKPIVKSRDRQIEMYPEYDGKSYQLTLIGDWPIDIYLESDQIEQVTIILGQKVIKQEVRKGLYHVGMLRYNGNYQITLIQKYIQQFPTQYSFDINAKLAYVLPNKQMISGNMIIDIRNGEMIQRIQPTTVVKVLKNEDIILGTANGELIWMKTENTEYYVHQRYKYFDKRIMDIIELEGSFVVSSQDKLALIGTQIDYQESVDKSYIHFLAPQMKGFITGYEDGRIRTWRKEKNQFIQQRTLVASRNQVMYYMNQLVIVGTMEKGHIEIYNLEIQRQTKLMTSGHSNTITALTNHGDYLISGCLDGRVVLWDINQGQMLKHLSLSSVCSITRSLKTLIIQCDELVMVEDWLI